MELQVCAYYAMIWIPVPSGISHQQCSISLLIPRDIEEDGRELDKNTLASAGGAKLLCDNPVYR